MSDRFLNLVFQGGAMRGVAYAGVLDAMPDKYRIHSVAGTSAGAIAAALVAIGKRRQLRDLLRSNEVREMLDPATAKQYAAIASAWAELGPMLAEGANSWSLGRAVNRHRSVVGYLRNIWSRGGVHSHDRLRRWLDKALEGKTFRDIAINDLQIVAADTARQKYRVFNKQNDLDRPIAQAVLASAAIPIFFEPVRVDGEPHVDGGLLSNFPAYLFVNAEYPTVGFRLVDLDPPERVVDTSSYLRAIVHTALTAHDKLRGLPHAFTAIDIPVRAGFDSRKFSIEPADEEALYQAGLAAGRSVDWEECSAKVSQRYVEPKPAQALHFALSQGKRLWDLFGEKELWADALHYQTTFEVRLNADWSSDYRVDQTVTLTGAMPLMLTRSFFEASGEEFRSASLVDVQFNYEEIREGVGHPLIRFPAVNEGHEKGFVMFFNPPITERGGPRRFRAVVHMPHEFQQTLGRGRADSVAHQVRQLAHDHKITLKFRLLIDPAHRSLTFETDFGQRFTSAGTIADQESGRSYDLFECDLGPVMVTAESTFSARIVPT